MKKSMFIICLPLLITGCASMSQEECATADWNVIGYEDGLRGKARDSFSDRRKACAEYGVSLDLESYQSGYERGLPFYCTADNGFKVGDEGGTDNGVCPVDLRGAFSAGYDDGRALFELRSRLEALSYELNQKEEALKRAKRKATEIKTRLINETLTSTDKSVLLNKMEEWQLTQGELEHEIRDLDVEIALEDAAYHDLEAQLR